MSKIRMKSMGILETVRDGIATLSLKSDAFVETNLCPLKIENIFLSEKRILEMLIVFFSEQI